MDHWGVSPCCSNPPVATVDHRNDTNTPINTTESHPHPPKPPRPSGVTNVGPTTAIATHNLAGPLCPNEGRATIDKCCAPDSHIATVWTCPTPTDTHTARRWTNNTHTIKAIALCALQRPTCPQSGAIERHQAGMQPQQRKHIGTSPPYGEDTPGRRQVQRKEKEGVHQQRVLC